MGLQLNSNEIAEILPHRYPLRAGGPHHRRGIRRVGQGYQVRQRGRAVFLRPLPPKARHARCADLRGAGPGGGRGDSVPAGEPGKIALFGGVKNARFKRQVIPGDVLELECTLTKRRGPVGIGACTATVNGETACTAELIFAIQ